jgi:hypothetical protein
MCDKVCHLTGQWFSPDSPVSSTNKTDRHNVTEIVLKVALNTIQPNQYVQAVTAYPEFTLGGVCVDHFLVFCIVL